MNCGECDIDFACAKEGVPCIRLAPPAAPAPAAPVPDGWVMVPREPTPEMLAVVRNGPMHETWTEGYCAMIAASPAAAVSAAKDAEIAGLRAELIKSLADNAALRADAIDRQNNVVAPLRAEVAGLREDAERLDFLLHKLPGDSLRYVLGELSDTSDEAEFRAAIDAARKQKP